MGVFSRSFLLLLTAACAAHAADDVASRERAAVQAEMQRIEATHAADEAACRTKFVVTACVEDTRRRQRDALAPLRARLLALDDAERRQRAQQRLKAVEAKQREVAQRPEAPDLPAASAPRRAPPAPHPAPPRGDTAAQREQAGSAEAAERAAASARRRQAIGSDAERIRQRIEERERKGKRSAPLPVPGASAPR